MVTRNEETGSLTLRSIRKETIDALYECKALDRRPICRLVDEIVSDWVEKNPRILQRRQEEVRRLAEEYGAHDDTASDGADSVDDDGSLD